MVKQGLLALAMLAGASSWAMAQTAPATGPGAQTGTPGTPGSSQPIDKEVDLPVDAPTLGAQKQQPPTPPPPPTPVDNPTQPPTLYGKDIKSENGTVVYVIDISGSMGWDMGQYTAPDGSSQTGCRLDRAKAELTKSVISLPKTFKFNMYSFDCGCYPWQGQLQPADDAHKQDAIGWVNQLQPQGATGTGPGMAQALTSNHDCKLFVLLTDGAPNCGAGDESGDESCRQAHRQMIDQNNTQHAIINVFGISAYGEMKQFCMDVAADNGGTYIDVQ